MSKSHFGLLALCLSLSVVSIGCSNPKEVSKDNFGKVIAQSLKEHPEKLVYYGLGYKDSCFYDVGSKLTAQGDVYPAKAGRDIGASPGTYSSGDRLDILAKLGLFTSQVIKEDETPYNGKMVTKEYTPTDQGKSKIMSTKSGRRYIPFCKIALKSVTSYIEPSDAGYGKQTYVKFTYMIEDVDAWAKDPANQDVFPQLKAVNNMIGKPIEANMNMVLTSEGWVNSDDSVDKL
jgi:hypothetical protein